MSTQLRLVEAPAVGPSSRQRRPSKARISGPARRAAHWGEWHLDARTRKVGRAGVATARQALQDARAAEELSEAS